MPTPRIYNKHTCSCGMPFSTLRLLNSHYQLYPSHKIIDNDIVMQETDSIISSDNTRKLFYNLYP